MIDLYEAGKKQFNWWQDWRGECAAIVASGPSAKTAGVEKLKDRIHVIAVNQSFELCPWAEVLYSCDAGWWQLRAGDVRNFPGIKVTLDDTIHAAWIKDINKIQIQQHRNIWLNDFLFDRPGVLGSGGQSGFQAINLAAQFGATGIALVGFDAHVNGSVHWHGPHPSPLRNPDAGRCAEWRRILDEKAPKIAAQGIDVVNCSQTSALTAFKKMTIDEMLERWGL